MNTPNNNKSKVRVLIPRMMSGQVKGQIITMFNLSEDVGEIFYLFGGCYEVLSKEEYKP